MTGTTWEEWGTTWERVGADGEHRTTDRPVRDLKGQSDWAVASRIAAKAKERK